MNEAVRMHYEMHPYPHFGYGASVLASDTYALNMETLWAKRNGELPPPGGKRILLAGCGSFSPYPTSVANPRADIIALDLSQANLRRARIHSQLHGRRNISYLQGDLLNHATAPGPFSFIDSFGVLHHLEEPLAGLKALERRLAPGGIIRIMVYSRHGRKEEESIRRALRLLGVRNLDGLRRLARRARKGSRFATYLSTAPEASHASGLADALLHPRVTTFSVDTLLNLCADAGLQPLLFAHGGSVSDVAEEVCRLRQAECENTLCTNFTLYLGRAGNDPPLPDPGRLLLNPALKSSVSRLQLGTVHISPKLGRPNPPLDSTARAFLRRFVTPQPIDRLTREELQRVRIFQDALFLMTIR